MTPLVAKIFRSRLKILHNDLGAIRKLLRQIKQNPEKVDNKILSVMIENLEIEVRNIEREMREQKRSEEVLEWYYSLSKK